MNETVTIPTPRSNTIASALWKRTSRTSWRFERPLMVDEDARSAAHGLGCRRGRSTSEPTRRAVPRLRDAAWGASRDCRAERRRTLERLFGLFQDQNPADEVRRLKEEDEGF